MLANNFKGSFMVYKFSKLKINCPMWPKAGLIGFKIECLTFHFKLHLKPTYKPHNKQYRLRDTLMVLKHKSI